MATRLRLTRGQRLANAVGRVLMHVLPTRESSPMVWGVASRGDDDEGTAGVREPRRPKPGLPTLSAEERPE